MDHGLRISRTRNARLVKVLVRSWHSTHPPPVSWRVVFFLYHGGEVVGVSTWGRPVARAEDQVTTLEHTRMALGPGAPKNSGSWFLAANRHWIRENMPDVRRLIAYVDESNHSGVTYRADNWVIVYRRLTKTQSWSNRPGRTGTKAGLRTKFEHAP
ncbi:MAG: hypothetical protein IVW52_04955 [Acidimicrobiales bacterium]|nr:hypothetical protein [Acidimicrobiales bacterium]